MLNLRVGKSTPEKAAEIINGSQRVRGLSGAISTNRPIRVPFRTIPVDSDQIRIINARHAIPWFGTHPARYAVNPARQLDRKICQAQKKLVIKCYELFIPAKLADYQAGGNYAGSGGKGLRVLAFAFGPCLAEWHIADSSSQGRNRHGGRAILRLCRPGIQLHETHTDALCSSIGHQCHHDQSKDYD